jgi:hypothetical protein
MPKYIAIRQDRLLSNLYFLSLSIIIFPPHTSYRPVIVIGGNNYLVSRNNGCIIINLLHSENYMLRLGSILISALYGTQKFLKVFKGTYHWILSRVM